MKITDFISITELARLTGKSRPTLYKYIADYESGRCGDIPLLMLDLFRLIDGGCARSAVYRYCEENFAKPKSEQPQSQEEKILAMIRAHKGKIDLKKLEEFLNRDE